jgi:hypothetical protein
MTTLGPRSHSNPAPMRSPVSDAFSRVIAGIAHLKTTVVKSPSRHFLAALAATASFASRTCTFIVAEPVNVTHD